MTRDELEKEAKNANRLTEFAEDCLPEEFILDDVVGELVYKEYSNGINYFINIGVLEICIEDYKIIAENAKNHLVKGGVLLLECGIEQAETVKNMLTDSF